MRVALFVTCLNDTFFPATGIAVVRVLERLGHTVDFPTGQTCCGQMHFNAGYQPEAVGLARAFVSVFADAETVVTPSASCAAMVREHFSYLADQSGDGQLASDVAALVPRMFELTELLDRLGVEDLGASYPHRVTYHPTCHALRLLRVGPIPERLLRAVSGLELVELGGAEECCGFGGTFAVKNADTSNAILDDKLAAIARTGAEVVTALDNSCLMHIGGALSRRGASARPLHLAEILAS